MISTFKVSIGLDEENAPEESDYTEVKFDVELHKDKVYFPSISRLKKNWHH
jgi:hypothetical protein